MATATWGGRNVVDRKITTATTIRSASCAVAGRSPAAAGTTASAIVRKRPARRNASRTSAMQQQRTSAADGGRRPASLSAVLLSVAAVACAAAAVDWERAAAVCRRWASAAAERYSPTDRKCAVTLPDFLEDVLRPPINCSYCEGLEDIDKVFDLSAEDFEKHYAYTGRPVVVAADVPNVVARSAGFGFRLFRDLSASKLLTPCQYFPYKTEFATLEEALRMDERRAEMAPGYVPWYIGWSNCKPKTINRLKKHVTLPNFLPTLSNSKQTLWIFMGTPGHGAPMHIDKVGYPSWQTQIRGHKKWTLRTPLECFFQCKRQFEVLMEPGWTIVLDTNIWYHETQTVGNDVSITVGGEYD